MNQPNWKIREYPRLGTFTIQTSNAVVGCCLTCFGFRDIMYLVEPGTNNILNKHSLTGVTFHHWMHQCHCLDNAQSPGGDRHKWLVDLLSSIGNSSADEIRQFIQQQILLESKKQVEEANAKLVGLHRK